MTIKWDEITIDNLSNLEKALKIFDRVFPVEVRESHDIFLKSLQYAKRNKPNNFRFLVGFEGEKMVSFATGHYLADVNVGFIVYIFTDPVVRSKGLGTKTLLELEKLLNKDAFLAGYTLLKAVILETETEEMVHTEIEKQDCIKRNKFFERNNYKQYKNIDYLQPPLHFGASNIPLNLFIKRVQLNEINDEEVSNAIRSIFREKYYIVNEIDKDIIELCLKTMGVNNEALFNN
ncbi:GNAT family N-acetyltransferase [Peribacillus aracenensis]|uniref:GNAT family N-acetyltransferase n=1 Tax=Peribacillus aracenensis TaxID=2976708 RepID=UPI0021A4A5DE|nr:GNAT family N-acetyltransferase [Peribacillus sp. BBB004]